MGSSRFENVFKSSSPLPGFTKIASLSNKGNYNQDEKQAAESTAAVYTNNSTKGQFKETLSALLLFLNIYCIQGQQWAG